jgi:murein DD-endopeptidase MepM/ murein hydrolase activator NlpD
LTHMFAQTRHALDFRCPVGTPVVAVGDGEVVDVRQDADSSGIHVGNLFEWNSVMIRVDSVTPPVFVEYVHIQKDSVVVKKGERVVGGQTICSSGNVGFCPEPHLHIQAHDSDETNAPTIPFGFNLQGRDKESKVVPKAGEMYP